MSYPYDLEGAFCWEDDHGCVCGHECQPPWLHDAQINPEYPDMSRPAYYFDESGELTPTGQVYVKPLDGGEWQEIGTTVDPIGFVEQPSQDHWMKALLDDRKYYIDLHPHVQWQFSINDKQAKLLGGPKYELICRLNDHWQGRNPGQPINWKGL